MIWPQTKQNKTNPWRAVPENLHFNELPSQFSCTWLYRFKYAKSPGLDQCISVFPASSHRRNMFTFCSYTYICICQGNRNFIKLYCWCMPHFECSILFFVFFSRADYNSLSRFYDSPVGHNVWLVTNLVWGNPGYMCSPETWQILQSFAVIVIVWSCKPGLHLFPTRLLILLLTRLTFTRVFCAPL